VRGKISKARAQARFSVFLGGAKMGGKQVLAAGAAREGPGWADAVSFGCFYSSANRASSGLTNLQRMKLGAPSIAYFAMGGKAKNLQALFVLLNLTFCSFVIFHLRRLQPIPLCNLGRSAESQ
jgi:hypothetical protein